MIISFADEVPPLVEVAVPTAEIITPAGQLKYFVLCSLNNAFSLNQTTFYMRFLISGILYTLLKRPDASNLGQAVF